MRDYLSELMFKIVELEKIVITEGILGPLTLSKCTPTAESCGRRYNILYRQVYKNYIIYNNIIVKNEYYCHTNVNRSFSPVNYSFRIPNVQA